jgi:hypothetical protein
VDARWGGEGWRPTWRIDSYKAWTGSDRVRLTRDGAGSAYICVCVLHRLQRLGDGGDVPALEIERERRGEREREGEEREGEKERRAKERREKERSAWAMEAMRWGVRWGGERLYMCMCAPSHARLQRLGDGGDAPALEIERERREGETERKGERKKETARRGEREREGDAPALPAPSHVHRTLPPGRARIDGVWAQG